MVEIDIPSRWKRATLTEEKRAYSKRHLALIDDEKTRKFMEDIAEPVSHLEGDSIPISKVILLDLFIMCIKVLRLDAYIWSHTTFALLLSQSFLRTTCLVD